MRLRYGRRTQIMSPRRLILYFILTPQELRKKNTTDEAKGLIINDSSSWELKIHSPSFVGVHNFQFSNNHLKVTGLLHILQMNGKELGGFLPNLRATSQLVQNSLPVHPGRALITSPLALGQPFQKFPPLFYKCPHRVLPMR